MCGGSERNVSHAEMYSLILLLLLWICLALIVFRTVNVQIIVLKKSHTVVPVAFVVKTFKRYNTQANVRIKVDCC